MCVSTADKCDPGIRLVKKQNGARIEINVLFGFKNVKTFKDNEPSQLHINGSQTRSY